MKKTLIMMFISTAIAVVSATSLAHAQETVKTRIGELALGAATSAKATVGQSKQPNIVLILMDNLLFQSL